VAKRRTSTEDDATNIAADVIELHKQIYATFVCSYII